MGYRRAFPKPVTGTGTVVTGRTLLLGLSVRDTSAATNTIRIYDNTSASGTILFTQQLAANASVTFTPHAGVDAHTGLHLTSTGAIEGSVHVG